MSDPVNPIPARGLRVRAALPADREALLTLRCALWPQLDLAHHERELQRRAAAPARHQTLLLEDESGRACGFAELTRDAAEHAQPARVVLQCLFVSPPARRRGAARLLLAAAERWAHGRGAAALVCELDAADDAARRALEWLGFGEPEHRLRVVRRVSAPLEMARTPAAPGPVAASASTPPAPARRPMLALVNVMLLVAATVSFAQTDIFARDMVRGVLLPLLDVVFVLYFLAVVLTWRYRRRADSSARAERLFRGDG